MRPRNTASRDLPRNLYFNSNGYFVYKRPDTQTRISLGKDRSAAIEAACQANEKLIPRSALLIEKILPTIKKKLVSAQIDELLILWEERVAKGKRNPKAKGKMSDKTLKEYRNMVNKFNSEFGEYEIGSITLEQVSEYLKKFPDTSRVRNRGVLNLIWTHAKAGGFVTENIVEATIKGVIDVERQRLTLEDFHTIREFAPPHYQNLFDLALQTIQRREDLSALKKENDVVVDGKRYLRVVQIKTGARIMIEVGKELAAVLKRCQTDTVSEFILHYPYTNDRNRRFVGKPFSPDAISDAFTKARNMAIKKKGLFKGMIAAQYPTFHEIRALGAKLYEKRGVDPGPLLGHKSRKMTDVYLGRHEETWTVTKAGLSL